MPSDGLFAELRRRNVFKGSVLYLVVSWVILQVAELLLDALGLPQQWLRLILVLLVLGFPLLLVFSWVYEITPEGIKRERDIAPGESTNILTGMRINLMILVLMAIAVGLQLVDHLGTTSPTPDLSATTDETVQTDNQSLSANTPPAVTTTEPTIAVLPFANMSSDPEQEYFADGVAEEILNSLSRISQLQVRGRTSSFYFKGRNEDLKSIAAQLNVDHILEGSVRKSGDRVRITVQLIHVPSDAHLWSKTYDEVLDDIFAIQEDIATSVASSLEVSLGIGELGSEPGMTRNVGAYELFLDAIKQFGFTDRSHNLRAIELLEHAVDLDPQFALGWAVLAVAYRTTGAFFVPEKAAHYHGRAEAAISRAEQTTPGLWVVGQLNAHKLQAQRRWLEAEQVLRRLEKTRGTSRLALSGAAGFFEANVGHIREALAIFEKEARAEPLNQAPVALVAAMYAVLGDYEAAQATYDRAKRLPAGNPSVVNGGELMLAMAQYNSAAVKREVRELLEQPATSIQGKSALEFFSVMAPLLDSPETALETVRRFAVDPDYHLIGELTKWAAYLGDPQLALDLLHTENQLDFIGPLALWHPLLAEMRRLPGFKQQVIDFGLVEYWRATGRWGDFCKPVGENDFECH